MRKVILLIIFILNYCVVSKAQNPDKSWWTFNYPNYKSLDSGLLNLRYLNEKSAGENGFIKLSADGNSFLNGNGKEVRFWASNGGGLAGEFNDLQLDTLAKFLAKTGVNLVRYHGAINPTGKNSKLTDVNSKELNNIWRCVAAMKKQGIYTVISPFWPHNGHMGGWVPKEWGIDGYSGQDDLWAVLYFDEKLQEAYKAWVKQLYTLPNPYTGIALKDEPALAVIQIENEDSAFFWTFSNIKPELDKKIRGEFAEWLIEKYGSIKSLMVHWGSATGKKGDDFGNRLVGLYPIYELTISSKGYDSVRLKDQTEFVAWKQRSFYDGMATYYRRDLSCKQLINGNNWRTASQSRLLDLERWTNSGVDVMAVNKYFDPEHHGSTNEGWRIDPLDFYAAPSALKNPTNLPTNIKHVEGHPMMVTESAWNLPNKYQTEGALLVASYGGLTGLDAFFWFSPTAPTFANQLYFNFVNLDGQHPLNRWSISTPGEMGMFPANALIHRLGYVKSARSVTEQRSLKSLYNREVPEIFEEQSFDPNRDFVSADPANEGKRELSPLTFLTGGVATSYQAKAKKTNVKGDLVRLIDTKNETVTSVTSEQQLDYGNGIFILNTPKAKAVSGFLKAKTVFNIGKNLSIESGNEYATIELVSMDGKDIESSKKILLQVGTIFRPTDWKEEASTFKKNNKETNGFKILNTGKMPWLGMPLIKTVISVQNSSIKKATQLDAAGYSIKEIPLEFKSGGFKIICPEDSYYILLER
ncbi:hypothetical protein [Pedobacter sp. JCM 36344]|uniref:hypothetical protein n=1 Tax=Pedobacter sp. JCM 36344 TaxID=3374280 RepID=UPI00397E553F